MDIVIPNKLSWQHNDNVVKCEINAWFTLCYSCKLYLVAESGSSPCAIRTTFAMIYGLVNAENKAIIFWKLR